MLAQLRSMTRSWIARILLGAIALFMAITLFQGDFIRGITGMFQPSGVAVVAGETIAPRLLQREFDLYLRGQQNSGRTVSRADAIEARVPQGILESIIQRKAIHAYAAALGVYASDLQLGEAIQEIPRARSEITGRFDRSGYLAFLREIGYAPGEFESEFRADIGAAQLMRSMSAGLRAPSSYGALILAYQSERRTVSVAEITAARIGAIPAPNDAQLQDYYRDNAAAFAVPEYRALTIVAARAADFAARAQISEERLRAEFDARRESLSVAEKRSFVQLSSPDESKARQAAERLARGEDPAAIASALGMQAVSQTDKTQAEIADGAVARAVFALRPGAPPQAVRGRLGWSAVRLDSVTAGVAPTFENEREALRQELALHDGADAMDAAIEAFERARDAGTPIADAARANGLAVTVIPAVDAQGRTPQGAPAEGVTETPDLIAAGFETQEGEATDFMPVGDGVDAIVQVDRVIPATTRPFEEVRENLVRGWTARERGRQMRELGEQVAAAVRDGQSFEAAAAAARVPVMVRSQSLDRASARNSRDPQLAQMVFGGDLGTVVLGLRPDASALLLVNIENIERADPRENAQVVEQFRQQIQQQVGQSLVGAIDAAAIERAHVRRNEDRLAALFSSADQDNAPNR